MFYLRQHVARPPGPVRPPGIREASCFLFDDQRSHCHPGKHCYRSIHLTQKLIKTGFKNIIFPSILNIWVCIKSHGTHNNNNFIKNKPSSCNRTSKSVEYMGQTRQEVKRPKKCFFFWTSAWSPGMI